MPLLEELLSPVEGPSPGGQPLRNSPLYDKIKLARLQDDDLPQGVWKKDRKLADFPQVIQLSKQALAKGKDLQVAAWLTEALVQVEGFSGLNLGLSLSLSLLQRFWDSLYPPIEDDDLEARAAPLKWLGMNLERPIKSCKLVKEPREYNWYKFNESRIVGNEKAPVTEEEQAKRKGKVSAEEFDKAFAETEKMFYVDAEKKLDACLAVLVDLNNTCNQKFPPIIDPKIGPIPIGPSFEPLEKALNEVRHTVHHLLEKKRETEPDPIETPPPQDPSNTSDSEAAPQNGNPGDAPLQPPKESQTFFIPVASSDPPATRDAIATIARQAALLRERDPYSPAPYLLMRGLRWGELRAAAGADPPDPSWLEAPPTDLRRQIKAVALSGKWVELLNIAEKAMSHPCSRAWLDLQRFVVQACVELGPSYHNVAKAIQSEIKALIRDVPQLLTATLMDDTPAANPETQAWIQELLQADANADTQTSKAAAVAPSANGIDKMWTRKLTDTYKLANDALRRGSPAKALEILIQDVEAQRSGRSRFQRKIQIVELCVAFNRPEIAQPVLEELAAAIETHKLEAWEDPTLVSRALVLIMKNTKKVQDSAAEKAKMFERICRIDPLRALEL